MIAHLCLRGLVCLVVTHTQTYQWGGWGGDSLGIFWKAEPQVNDRNASELLPEIQHLRILGIIQFNTNRDFLSERTCLTISFLSAPRLRSGMKFNAAFSLEAYLTGPPIHGQLQALPPFTVA